MTARLLATPATEVRLRAERDELRRMLAALVGSLPDPETEITYRQALCAEAYEQGREAGIAAGYGRCTADYEAAWRAVARPVARSSVPAYGEVEQRRGHLCCGQCRRGGHQPGCEQCEDRCQETYGSPHPGDYQGGALPAIHRGKVWLGGPAVHYHQCTSACTAYRPGWYTRADAEVILAALPGDRARRVA